MKIKNVKINGFAALAPMAGISDKAFREICCEFGASYVVSEMVSSNGISYLNEKTIRLMDISNKERPCGIQIFGADPQTMANAAILAMKHKPDIIDINMGCPAPKINKNGYGCALMKNPELCGEIVYAVKKVSNVPVTVKIRKGWNESSPNADLVAKICEEAGADAITIHGRTREQMYKPGIDFNIIKRVKNTVSIPVIGNGDITCAEEAKNMMDKTGCDLIMVGRAAIGNPWIFSEINQFLKNGVILPKPSLSEKMDVMLKHISLICKYKGEKNGLKQARRHVSLYIKGLHGAAALRDLACKIESFEDAKKLANIVLKQENNGEN